MTNILKILPFYFLLLLLSFPYTALSQSSCVEGEVKIGSRSFQSIERAISRSKARDVIELGSGVFDESLNISRKSDLTIQSACFAQVKRLNIRNSNNFHLKGVSIKGGEGANFALRILNTSVKIEEGHIFNSSSSGVWVSGNSKALFSKLSVYNNSTGFVLDAGAEIEIKDSSIYGNKRDGIFLKDVFSVIIEDTDIYNNKASGISSYQNSQAIRSFLGINRSQIYSNGSYGINLQASFSFRISNSVINDNPLIGFQINKKAVSALNNKDSIESVLIENNGTGVLFASPQALDLIRNEFIGNEGSAFLYSNLAGISPDVFLRGNTFTGNKGRAERGVSSRDLQSYSRYLDNEDTGNETSLNSEGLGVGNHRPVASAGEDVLFSSVNDKVSLSSKGSYDLDGESLSYSWSVVKKPSGSTAGVENSDKPLAFFSPDVLGDYEIELKVSDGKQSSKDKLQVSSKNISPKAIAGLDQLVSLNDRVMLDGSLSSDTKGSNLSYSWSFVKKPVGSTAQIRPKRGRKPSFTVDKAGDYEIELEVSDGSLSSKDRVLVSTINLAPQVEITSSLSPALSQALSLSSVITDEDLNNRGSEDRKVSYKWSVLSSPAGEAVYRFSNTKTKDTSFTALSPGDYVLQLTADDGELYGLDTVLLTYGNQAPAAKTGRNIPNAILNKKVDLNGEASSDPEGKDLSYEWSFNLKPRGSMAVIGDAKKQRAFFIPDKVGVYRVSLKVSDGFL
ncbi:MAG: right-handed parallel beta-helix repeat-containing protein, partial [Oligoflexia bacterium]|nr:right-handed parallel beta-helix repeat-containing protein [Oligoflexia bacterium]